MYLKKKNKVLHCLTSRKYLVVFPSTGYSVKLSKRKPLFKETEYFYNKRVASYHITVYHISTTVCVFCSCWTASWYRHWCSCPGSCWRLATGRYTTSPWPCACLAWAPWWAPTSWPEETPDPVRRPPPFYPLRIQPPPSRNGLTPQPAMWCWATAWCWLAPFSTPCPTCARSSPWRTAAGWSSWEWWDSLGRSSVGFNCELTNPKPQFSTPPNTHFGSFFFFFLFPGIVCVFVEAIFQLSASLWTSQTQIERVHKDFTGTLGGAKVITFLIEQED